MLWLGLLPLHWAIGFEQQYHTLLPWLWTGAFALDYCRSFVFLPLPWAILMPLLRLITLALGYSIAAASDYCLSPGLLFFPWANAFAHNCIGFKQNKYIERTG